MRELRRGCFRWRVTWVMSVLYCSRDDKVNILQVSKTAVEKWHGQTIEALVQTAPKIIEHMPDRLLFDEEEALKIFIEGWKQRCFQCELTPLQPTLKIVRLIPVSQKKKPLRRKPGKKQPNPCSHITPPKKWFHSLADT